MAYSLRLHEKTVLPYLRDLAGLSRQARLSLFANLHDCLRVHGDTYRNDPSLRRSEHQFDFDIIIRDGVSGQIYQFRFVVDDSAAEYGVLHVVYVDAVRRD